MNKLSSARISKALGKTKWYASSITNPSAASAAAVASAVPNNLSFVPRSVILVSTPQFSHQYAEKARALAKANDDLQVFYASVDTVAPFSSRNAVSMLWLDRRFSIASHKLYAEREAAKPGRTVSATQNWHSQNGTMGLRIPIVPSHLHNHYTSRPKASRVSLTLGSTLFHNNGLFNTCLYEASNKEKRTLSKMDPKSFPEIKEYLDHSGMLLSEVEVEIPPLPSKSRFNHYMLYNSLQKIETGDLQVTSTAGNLIKTINGVAASSVIQDNDAVMSQMSKDSRIFAVLDNKWRLEVVAGGGAWGSRASVLALDPSGVEYVKNGAKISFYLSSELPQQEVFSQKQSQMFSKNQQGIIVETSLPQTEFEAEKGEELLTVGVFGVGSENGLFLDDVKYDSLGETIYFPVEKSVLE